MKLRVIRLRVSASWTERARYTTCEAEVFGTWAAHPEHRHQRFWLVTHVPSGASLEDYGGELSRDEARAVAKVLSELVPQRTVPAIMKLRRVIESIVAATLEGDPA